MKIFKFLVLLLVLSNCAFAQQPYVLLISFDGFRWDYPNRGITPNIEKMREDGVSASSLRPTFPSKTFPNHYAIISGMYNDHHGIIANFFENPFTKEIYRLGDSLAVTNSKWYLGEPFWTTAERQGVISASYFWPGSEQKLSYRHPTYFEKYDHFRPHNTSVDGVIKWLRLPREKRPHFITLYFHDTDDKGHHFGPRSEEINNAIMSLDSVIGYLYQRFDDIGMRDSVNVILVSDHGMTEIDTNRTIHIDKILNGFDYKMGGTRPVMTIKPAKKNDFDEIFKTLKKNEFHYKVYKKENLPEFYHYKDDPFIYPIILVADLGWSLVNQKFFNEMADSGDKGNHGYDNNQIDMHGIFIAAGPAFKNGYKTGTVWNIDIYPLLCKIFNIYPRSNIDGRLERIEFILKAMDN
ncbi:MAG: alkaline phosphatase family protein [Chlorobi bacterium]|nr:alkaline phosphatase family protein [Chlorobiota bacterium]